MITYDYICLMISHDHISLGDHHFPYEMAKIGIPIFRQTRFRAKKGSCNCND